MAVRVGDKLPDANLAMMTAEGPKTVSTRELFRGKRTALFAIPGAFTPTCSAKHLPGFIANAASLKAKGVDQIVCLGANDVFVMAAWGKEKGAEGKVLMLADGSNEFTKKIGMEFDLTAKGLGLRTQRYSMLIDDGVVEKLNVDEGGQLKVSDAETLLKQL
jgi:peroxiredoxin